MDAQTYSAGDCRKMSVSEKIEFLHLVHTEEISLWDDDGNENEIWKDYDAVQDELLARPEVLDCGDILHVMRIFDDGCFELSWQLNLAKILTRSCLYHGKERIALYLRHLEEVPSGGRFHGWHIPMGWLAGDENLPVFKAALEEQSPETKETILTILADMDLPPEKRAELDAVLN